MPIVGERNDVHIEYSIPENIKEMITDDFLKEFRKQLFRIHSYWSLDSFEEDGVVQNTSTAGWYAAFGMACINTNKQELFKYNKTLDWYDGDIFDYELSNMLITRGLMLGSIKDIISKQLNIPIDEIEKCTECERHYPSDMVKVLTKEEKEQEYLDIEDRICRCLYCYDKNTSKSTGVTDYYEQCCGEIKKL